MVTGLVLCPSSLGEGAHPQDLSLRLALDNQANALEQIPFCIICFGGGLQFPQHSGTVNVLEFALAVVLPLLRRTKESLVYFGEGVVLLF